MRFHDDLAEKLKDRVQDDDDVLPGGLRIGVNQDRYAYEGRTKQGTGSAKGALSAKQSDRPSLLSVLIGKDLLEDNNKPKPAVRASIIRELTKDASVNSTASSNSTSTPLSTETPEVDGYYRIDTRRVNIYSCFSWFQTYNMGNFLPISDDFF